HRARLVERRALSRWAPRARQARVGLRDRSVVLAACRREAGLKPPRRTRAFHRSPSVGAKPKRLPEEFSSAPRASRTFACTCARRSIVAIGMAHTLRNALATVAGNRLRYVRSTLLQKIHGRRKTSCVHTRVGARACRGGA